MSERGVLEGNPGPQNTTMIGPRRTHPLSPLATGWKVIAGILAIVMAQNIGSLLDEITLVRVLWALGITAVITACALGASYVGWLRSTFTVDSAGVTLRSGLLQRQERFAPREKIESVSLEEPLAARLLGLTKIKVEFSGGSDSHLTIEFVKSGEADEIRRTILWVAQKPLIENRAPVEHHIAERPKDVDGESVDPSEIELRDSPVTASRSAECHDAVSNGDDGTDLAVVNIDSDHLLAKIPTHRVIHAMIRDLENIVATVISIVVIVATVIPVLTVDGFTVAALIAAIPALVAGPRILLKRLESAWGFISVHTPHGLRMRHGLLNSTTDNISAGKIQSLTLKRSLLWRSPRWTAVYATISGVGNAELDGLSTGRGAVLPVGTPEELRRTLPVLVPPLGSGNDAEWCDHHLSVSARSIEGLRAPNRWFTWISHRTKVAVVLPHAVVYRSGILTPTLTVIPRDRIQEVTLSDGPLDRRVGLLELTIRVAGDLVRISDIPRAPARELAQLLSRDAATSRRYSEKAMWAQPSRQLPQEMTA